MSKVLSGYIAGFCGISLTFGSFIACGTQLYKVSVHEDIDNKQTQATAPFSADKASPLYGIHAPKGWNGELIAFRIGAGLSQEQKVHLLAAMERWEWAVGRKLFSYQGEHSGVTGDSFKDLFSSLKDGINGHYLDDNWTKTGKPQSVLATTIWNNGQDTSIIVKADVRFNTQYYVIGDSMIQKATETKEVVDMQSLALHELGHLLGLTHIDEASDALSIMNPALFIGEGLASRNLSKGDIERIQKVYGCEASACNIDGLLAQQEKVDEQALTRAAETWLKTGQNSPTSSTAL